MNLDDLPALVKQLQDRSKESAAFDRLLNEVATSLADIVSLLERDKNDDSTGRAADAQAKALRDARPTVNVAAPTVNVAAPNVTVDVKPTPVQINVAAPKIEPVIQLMEGGEKYGCVESISFEYDKSGRVTSASLIRKT